MLQNENIVKAQFKVYIHVFGFYLPLYTCFQPVFAFISTSLFSVHDVNESLWLVTDNLAALSQSLALFVYFVVTLRMTEPVLLVLVC